MKRQTRDGPTSTNQFRSHTHTHTVWVPRCDVGRILSPHTHTHTRTFQPGNWQLVYRAIHAPNTNRLYYSEGVERIQSSTGLIALIVFAFALTWASKRWGPGITSISAGVLPKRVQPWPSSSFVSIFSLNLIFEKNSDTIDWTHSLTREGAN